MINWTIHNPLLVHKFYNMPSIHCGYINVEKAVYGAALLTEAGSIYIYPLYVPQSQFLIDNYISVLSDAERQRAIAFKQSNNSIRYMVGRIGLRMIVAACTQIKPNAICFAEKPGQKPLIANELNSSLHFSLSYSRDYCLLAIANYPIGIDIECVDAAKMDAALMKSFFSLEELKNIEQAEKSVERFFKYWTRKEALLKATGKGIGDWLPYAPVMEGNHFVASEFIGSEENWQLKSFRPADDYIACIAHPNASATFYYRNIQDYL